MQRVHAIPRVHIRVSVLCHAVLAYIYLCVICHVPRAPPGGVSLAVVHGAARLQPLALHVAALWASPPAWSAARQRVMRALPCWCLSFVKNDDMQPPSARPLPLPCTGEACRSPSALGPTGCMGRRPELELGWDEV